MIRDSTVSDLPPPLPPPITVGAVAVVGARSPATKLAQLRSLLSVQNTNITDIGLHSAAIEKLEIWSLLVLTEMDRVSSSTSHNQNSKQAEQNSQQSWMGNIWTWSVRLSLFNCVYIVLSLLSGTMTLHLQKLQSSPRTWSRSARSTPRRPRRRWQGDSARQTSLCHFEEIFVPCSLVLEAKWFIDNKYILYGAYLYQMKIKKKVPASKWNVEVNVKFIRKWFKNLI